MTTDTIARAGVEQAGIAARVLAAVTGIALLGWLLSGDPRIAGGPGFGLTESGVLLLGAGNLAVAALGRRWLAGLLLMQFSLLFTLIVAEFAFRFALGPRYYAPFQLHDRYLYTLVPGVTREHRGLPVNGGSTFYNINSRGFRGEEFAADPDSVTRVVIYGDSFIHAEYTELENTLAEQLRKRLPSPEDSPVEVINAGVAGYGPDQVLRRVEDELSWLQPDALVVAVFTGNDYGDLIRNKIYRLNDADELVESDYEFSDEILLNARLDRSELILKKVLREAILNLKVMVGTEVFPPFDREEAVESALQTHLDEFREYIVDDNVTINNLRSDPYSADISTAPDSPSAVYKTKLMDRVVERIGKAAAAADVPLLVIGIPHPMDVLDGDHASGFIRREKYPRYDASALTGNLGRITAQHGIPYVNLLPHFRSVDDPAGLYLLGGDDHWNDAGQALAAEVIARQLAASGWLRPQVAPAD